MALPSAVTLTTLTTEVWKACGIESPSAAQLTRSQDEWVQEILNDIWLKSAATGNTRLKSLEETLIDVSVDGQGYLSLGEGIDEELKITILSGSHTGIATAGAASSVTLAADEDITAANAEGKYILITSGTAVDGYRQIVDYNATTKVATVDSAWDTNPVATDTYMIVDTTHELEEVSITEMDSYQPTEKGIPSEFAKFDRKIYFNNAFDAATYGILMRYFLNIHEIDLTSTRFLRLLQNWQDVIKSGVKWKCLSYLDDQRYVAEKQIYEAKVANLVMKEIPYGGEFTGFTI